jgi:hypothetical protein
LIQALKEITAEERRQQLDELLSIVGDDAEGLLRMIQEGGSAAEFTQVRSVTELRGLGKEVWQGGDAQSYVDAERESWHR